MSKWMKKIINVGICVCLYICLYRMYIYIHRSFPGGSVVKNPPTNGDSGDVGSIPGSWRSFGEEMATHSSILAWEIPWTEELWPAIDHGVTKSRTQLSNWVGMHTYTHNRTLLSHLKKKTGISPFTTTWINLETITTSEISQIEKDKHCMVSFTCWSKTNKQSKPTSQKQRTEKWWLPGGWREAETGWYTGCCCHCC